MDEIKEIQLDNEAVSLKHLKTNRVHTISVNKNFSELHLKG